MLESELILRVLNCFESNGYSIISHKMLAQYGFSREFIKDNIKYLIDNNKIEDVSINGYYPKYKVLEKLDCYEFILDKDLPNQLKILLCKLKHGLSSYEKIPPRKLIEIFPDLSITTIYNYNHKIKQLNKGSIFDILENNSGIIKKSFEEKDFGLVVNKDGMVQIDSQLKNGEVHVKTYEYQCKHCGETNPEEFPTEVYSKSICKKCLSKLHRQNTISNLYTNCKKSWRIRSKKSNISPDKLEFNIDEEYIKEIWEKQNGRCYYTGIEFNTNDKYSNPSIDRIDSSKGYIKGNICICTSIVNKAKSDLSINEFKKMIIDLYNNINNF